MLLTLEHFMKRDDLAECSARYIRSAAKDLADALRIFDEVSQRTNDPGFSLPQSEAAAQVALLAYQISKDVDNFFGGCLEIMQNLSELNSALNQQQVEPTNPPIRCRPATASKDATPEPDPVQPPPEAAVFEDATPEVTVTEVGVTPPTAPTVSGQ